MHANPTLLSISCIYKNKAITHTITALDINQLYNYDFKIPRRNCPV